MKRGKIALFGALVVAGTVTALVAHGEDEKSVRLDVTSKALYESADRCFLTVRDQHTKYETTPDCVALSSLSMRYIEAGGGTSKTPLKYEHRFSQAQRVAWMAVAHSESCSGKTLRIW